MTRTVAVDFDGVIHAYSKGWQDGSIYDDPVPGALDGLRTLMQDYAVFVHTTRDPEPVAIWLSRHGLKAICSSSDELLPEFWTDQSRILVTRRKLPAVAYIDDRAIRFESWDRALDDMERLHDRPE
jgi:hypothetical protein